MRLCNVHPNFASASYICPELSVWQIALQRNDGSTFQREVRIWWYSLRLLLLHKLSVRRTHLYEVHLSGQKIVRYSLSASLRAVFPCFTAMTACAYPAWEKFNGNVSDLKLLCPYFPP